MRSVDYAEGLDPGIGGSYEMKTKGMMQVPSTFTMFCPMPFDNATSHFQRTVACFGWYHGCQQFSGNACFHGECPAHPLMYPTIMRFRAWMSQTPFLGVAQMPETATRFDCAGLMGGGGSAMCAMLRSVVVDGLASERQDHLVSATTSWYRRPSKLIQRIRCLLD
jgi:hypothetical protein